MRPVLSPAASRLWRDPQTLQLGRGGATAVVLAGLEESDRRLLALLDGTRDRGQVEQDAAAQGCPPHRSRELMALLGGAGVLVDAAARWPARLPVDERDRLAPDVASLHLLHRGEGLSVLERRDAASVLVLGAGRVGAPLAGLLAAAGVGSVDLQDDGPARRGDAAVGGLLPHDAGRRRSEAARERLAAVAPTTRSGPVPRPDLVVVAPVGARDDVDVRLLQRQGLTHLLAEVRDTVGVVGPLVVPGASPCLRCLDLARTDADPDWPALAVQLGRPARSPAACDAVLAAAVAAQAAQQALARLDGASPAALGGTLELALPDWRWRRRAWVPHPACECRWQTAVTAA